MRTASSSIAQLRFLAWTTSSGSSGRTSAPGGLSARSARASSCRRQAAYPAIRAATTITKIRMSSSSIRARLAHMERISYDEFAYFPENAAEFGLPYYGAPAVRREFVEVRPGCRLSALVWGTEPPEIVLLHGGAQNAHTWDTVALALHRPLVAVDLPGHGHSDAGALAGGARPSPDDLASD